MEKEKSITIQVPEGHEIDKEKSTFEKIVFKKVEYLPMSFDEMKIIDYYTTHNKVHHITSNPTYGENIIAPIYPTKEYAEAFWALSKLIWLRDAWNKGWKPDYTDKTEKFIICTQYNMLVTDTCYSYKFTMCFKTKKIRYDFFVQFKDLLEIAKPLL